MSGSDADSHAISREAAFYGYDAHCHLDLPELDAERDAMVARARAAGVVGQVLAGSDHLAWERTLAVAAQTGGVAILGVHPWEAATMDGAALEDALTRLRALPTVAIGELGLDALHAPDARSWERQRAAFRAQLQLAKERDLPVVIHGVRAWPELLATIARDGPPRRGGILHAWSGPPDLIDRAVKLGFYVSFACMVLRDRARKARESVPLVPAERLLIETDSPDMCPPGFSRGEPAHLVEVARGVGALRGEAPEVVAARAVTNLQGLLGIPLPGG